MDLMHWQYYVFIYGGAGPRQPREYGDIDHDVIVAGSAGLTVSISAAS
jgi:hypothetical protein